MRLKKFIGIISSVALVMAMSLFAVACGNKPGGNENKHSLSLDETSVEMIYGDAHSLVANYSGGEGLTLKWASDNESVAVVSDGVITAVGGGNAKITATYGDLTETCDVTVGFGDYVPELKIRHLTSDGIRLSLNSTYDVDPYVTFNGKSYPCEIVAESTDTDVVTFADGTLTAAGIGSAEVTLKTSWNSFGGALTEKTITVEVFNDVNVISVVTVGGETSVTNAIELSVTPSWQGNEYANTASVEFPVSENGNKSTVQGTVVSGSDVISFDNGNVTATGVGTAEIRADYTDALGNSYSHTLTVKVVCPVVDYNAKLEFCTENPFPVESLFGAGATIVSASSEGNPLPIEGGVIGLAAKGGDTATFEVQTTKGGYRFTDVFAYTRKITSVREFQNTFSLKYNQPIDGYYILGNDVDSINSSSWQTMGGGAATYFKGTLDGMGHTVTATVGKNGLFGALAGGAVIKNAKFVLTFTEGEACGLAYNNATFNKSDNNLSLATLENLSVVTTNYYAGSSAVMALKPDRLHMNKVYVRINGNAELGAYTEASSLRRALFSLDQSINDGAKDQFKGDVKDVYVVTGTFIPIANGAQWWGNKYNLVSYAYNDLDKLGSFTHNDNRPTEINYCKIKSGNAAGSAESKLFGTEVSDNEYYTYYYGAHPDYANGGIARFDTVAELKATGVTQVGDWIVE